MLNGVLAKNTGKTIEQIKDDTERDNFLAQKRQKNTG
jgi:ATP-dependent protease ClpP protease subunit